MSESYIIGTRGSMLAVAQCELIKEELEKRSGHKFTLKKIKTQGDLDKSKPLWQMDGKDFFTKELDYALINHEVDLVIHSYKDLGSERPEGIKLASITERRFGEDILLIKKETINKLGSLKELIVGTSSPRRIVNVESNLAKYLPNKKTHVKTKMLRGNVNTRIEKLLAGEFDAIILAFAGLERLASHPDTKATVKELFANLDFMIMPQSIFPSAASQGALAIEIADNRDHKTLLDAVKTVEDQKTVAEMQIERKRFQSYGGGCHLAVGIQTEQVNDFMFISERGKVDDKEVDYVALNGKRSEANKTTHIFLGHGSDKNVNQTVVKDELIDYQLSECDQVSDGHIFATSPRCLEFVKEGSAVWVSGSMSHEKAIEKGYWVRGSADSLGHTKIHQYISSNLIQLVTGFAGSDLRTLTGLGNQATLGKTIEVYQKDKKQVTNEYKNSLKQCGIFYWASYGQYQMFMENFKDFISTSAQHCCGIGKTYEKLSKELNVIAFYNLKEFKSWLSK